MDTFPTKAKYKNPQRKHCTIGIKIPMQQAHWKQPASRMLEAPHITPLRSVHHDCHHTTPINQKNRPWDSGYHKGWESDNQLMAASRLRPKKNAKLRNFSPVYEREREEKEEEEKEEPYYTT